MTSRPKNNFALRPSYADFESKNSFILGLKGAESKYEVSFDEFQHAKIHKMLEVFRTFLSNLGTLGDLSRSSLIFMIWPYIVCTTFQLFDGKDRIVSPVVPQPGAWVDRHAPHRFRKQEPRPVQKTPKFKEQNKKFQYGNYHRSVSLTILYSWIRHYYFAQ